MAFRPVIDGELSLFSEAVDVLRFLPQQEQPVRVIDCRLGGFRFVVIVHALRDRAECPAVLSGAAIAGLDEVPAAATPHQIPRLVDNHDLAPGAIQIHLLGDAVHDDLHHHRLKVSFALQFLQLQHDEVFGEFNRCRPFKVARIYAIFCVGFECHRHVHQLGFLVGFGTNSA